MIVTHKFYMSRSVISLLTVLSSMTVIADDLPLVTGIDKVTVFTRGAEVTRAGDITIPAGEHRLIIEDLPPGIDPARLQLGIDNSTVRLGNLQLEEIHEGGLVSEEEQRLQLQLEQLLDDRQQVTDEIESARTQLKLLDSLATGAVGGQQVSLAADELSALLETLASSSNQSRQVIRESNRQVQALDQEIEQVRFELSQVSTRQRSQQVLTIAVQASAAADSVVSITYPVARAGWSWLYESRLDTDSRELLLERKVSVTQTSGEDWDDVILVITTAQPNQNTQTPELSSLLVNFFRPRTQMMRELSVAPGAPGRAADSNEVEEVIVTGSFIRRSAGVEASAYMVNFTVPGRVTVAADSQPRILPIDQRGLEVELVSRAVPEFDSNAYLEARFLLEDTTPIQSGLMQFYRDGVFIGRRVVTDFLPGEEVSLAFGQDERVRVETRVVPQESRDGGTFRRTAIDDRRILYEITSFHNQAIELEVLGRVPVSQNEDINVRISGDATEADEVDVDGETGVLLWKRQAQPSQPVEIRHYYSISYPQDNSLEFQEF